MRKKVWMFLLILVVISGCQNAGAVLPKADLTLKTAAETCWLPAEKGSAGSELLKNVSPEIKIYARQTTDLQYSDDGSPGGECAEPEDAVSRNSALSVECRNLQLDNPEAAGPKTEYPNRGEASESDNAESGQQTSGMQNTGKKDSDKQIEKESDQIMKISVSSAQGEIIFALNDSSAAKELYEQLPLTAEVENFSTNEKIFYPPEKLSTEDTPPAAAELGSLCYYAPWGDVVMFYAPAHLADGLFALGSAISGIEFLDELAGEIRITITE